MRKNFKKSELFINIHNFLSKNVHFHFGTRHECCEETSSTYGRNQVAKMEEYSPLCIRDGTARGDARLKGQVEASLFPGLIN